jgi:hypothetical protein
MLQQVHFALSESTHRVLVKLASFLPGLLALLVAVLLFTLIGAALAALVRIILHSMRFDERLSRSNVFAGNANIQNSSCSDASSSASSSASPPWTPPTPTTPKPRSCCCRT